MKGKNKKQVMWIIDSGCSRHMTCDKALLSHYVEKADTIITFGDNNKGYTVGYGCLEIGNVVIEDIAFVDGLKHNLLSVSQFSYIGFKVDFDMMDCSIYHKKDGSISLKGVRKGNLFVADLNSAKKDKVYCFYNKATVGDNMLWHMKLSPQLQDNEHSDEEGTCKRTTSTGILSRRTV